MPVGSVLCQTGVWTLLMEKHVTAKPIWLSSVGENCVDVVQSPVYILKKFFLVIPLISDIVGWG